METDLRRWMRLVESMPQDASEAPEYRLYHVHWSMKGANKNIGHYAVRATSEDEAKRNAKLELDKRHGRGRWRMTDVKEVDPPTPLHPPSAHKWGLDR